jgi:hypothetical protein
MTSLRIGALFIHMLIDTYDVKLKYLKMTSVRLGVMPLFKYPPTLRSRDIGVLN